MSLVSLTAKADLSFECRIDDGWTFKKHILSNSKTGLKSYADNTNVMKGCRTPNFHLENKITMADYKGLKMFSKV